MTATEIKAYHIQHKFLCVRQTFSMYSEMFLLAFFELTVVNVFPQPRRQRECKLNRQFHVLVRSKYAD